MSEAAQMAAVAHYWAAAPLVTMAYDPEALHDLPTPWEMITNGDWCVNSVAVGMDFTLRLAGWSADRLRLKMMRDYDISDQKLVVEIDGKYWLNYDYGVVVDLPKTNHLILETWHFNGRKYEAGKV